jgi:CRP-like cAMP-binding protein
VVNELSRSSSIELSFDAKRQLIDNHPLFKFFPTDVPELISLMKTITVKKGEQFIKQGDFVDNYYMIASGRAEVTTDSPPGVLANNTILSILYEGESIGLNSSGIISANGRRTANVTAVTDTVLLVLSASSFNIFLKKHPEISIETHKQLDWVLKLDLVKNIIPFHQLSNDQIYALTEQMEEKSYAKDAAIFHENDEGDYCYLIRSGTVILYHVTDDGSETIITTLEEGAMFGEAALLTTSRRNASARAASPCYLFALNKKLIFDLIEVSSDFATSMMGFAIKFFKPIACKEVIVHERRASDGQLIVTLQNTLLDRFHRLTTEGWFIWKRLDGTQTIQDLTIQLFREFKIFEPDMICNLVYTLSETGFVKLPIFSIIPNEVEAKTLKEKFLNKLNKLMQIEFTFNHIDTLLTQCYQKGIWLLYKWPMQLLMIVFGVLGVSTFFTSSPHVQILIQENSHGLGFFIILLIIASVIPTVLHEAAHAFTAKKYGYKVQRVGVGWFWTGPVAFADTSELWLAEPKAKVAVDLAGVGMDLLNGAALAIGSSYAENPSLVIFLWMMALLCYFTALKNLSPIREFDGYFALMDWFDYTKLRFISVRWLRQNFSNFFKLTTLKNSRVEILYWISCLVYLVSIASFSFWMLQFLFSAFSTPFFSTLPTFYFSLGFSLLTFLMPCLGFWREIKSLRVK